MRARIRVELRQAGWHSGRMAWTKDVSEGGVLISVVQPPPVGDQVGVSLRIPGLGLTEMPAVVRHVSRHGDGAAYGVRRYDVGAEFVATDAESRGRLDETLDIVRREITDAPSGR